VNLRRLKEFDDFFEGAAEPEGLDEAEADRLDGVGRELKASRVSLLRGGLGRGGGSGEVEL